MSSSPFGAGALPATIAHYRITAKLGEGGMGVVYSALDEKLGRAVAIKTLHESSSDPLGRERLWREARAAAQINHPNVCQIYEIGEVDGHPYLAMELLEGESLHSRMGRGKMAVPDATPIVFSLLNALEALHKRALVHRDLKPSNVFLTPNGLKLLDFGLARLSHAMIAPGLGTPGVALDEQLTIPGTVIGTPRYIAPEVLEGNEADGRADLFACGAIFYEMLSGRPAFEGVTPMQVFHAVLYQQPAPLAGSPVIGALNRIVLKAMSKARNERYASANAMAEDVRGSIVLSDPNTIASASPMRRLIVLPFRVLRPDPEVDFLSASLPEAISSTLSTLGSLQVRSSLTAAKYASEAPDLRTLANEAGVDTVLTGSVLRAGEELQVTTQLVEAPSGTVVWSHRERLPLRDVFALEESVSRRVMESLALPVTDTEEHQIARDAPASPTAYEFYLRGTHQSYGTHGWRVARELYTKCLEHDPRYAPAWAALARCSFLLAKYSAENPEANYAKAQSALARALELNPDLGKAHSLLTTIEVNSGKTLDALVRLLRRARNHQAHADFYQGLVLTLRYCGLLDASIAANEHARRLDPGIVTSAPHTYVMRGDLERAIGDADSDPGMGALVLWLRGEPARARDRLVGFEMPVETGPLGAWMRFVKAVVEQDRESQLAATRVLTSAAFDAEGMYYAAWSFALLGEFEGAINSFARSVHEGFYCFPTFKRESAFDPIRTRPEFQDAFRMAQAKHHEAQRIFIEEGGPQLLGTELGD